MISWFVGIVSNLLALLFLLMAINPYLPRFGQDRLFAITDPYAQPFLAKVRNLIRIRPGEFDLSPLTSAISILIIGNLLALLF
jgi:hypothetical protein